jgi:hypothetical protein
MYGLSLSLSVTKWIHLNWGDEGIKTLFRKIHDLLNEGAQEPQLSIHIESFVCLLLFVNSI